MYRRLRITVIALVVLSCKGSPSGEPSERLTPSVTPAHEPSATSASKPETPFASEIAHFERLDAKTPPAPGAIVFVGSSSIRRWDSLAADMAPLPILNRGFGGSEFSDAIRYADRIIVNYKPSAVVIYSGDNDLAHANGKTPVSVAEEFAVLASLIREQQPEAPIYLLSIKPSPARMQHWPRMAKANALMEKHCKATEGLAYIDVASQLFDEEGKLRSVAFVEDGIHLSDVGYREWTQRIRPHLGL